MTISAPCTFFIDRQMYFRARYLFPSAPECEYQVLMVDVLGLTAGPDAPFKQAVLISPFCVY